MPAPADGADVDAPASNKAQQAQAVQLTPSLQSAFSPRFQPSQEGDSGSSRGSGSQLVFLSQQAACESGVHNGTTSVHLLQWPAVSDGCRREVV